MQQHTGRASSGLVFAPTALAQLALLAAIAAIAACAIVNLAPPPVCRVGLEEDIGCARGFETRERSGGRAYRWTDGDSAVTLWGAGYAAPLLAQITIAAPRPPEAPPPTAQIRAGPLAFSDEMSAQPRRYTVLVPPRPPLGDALAFELRSATFDPAHDKRDLGVQVFGASATPTGRWRIPGATLVLSLIGIVRALAWPRPRWCRRQRGDQPRLIAAGVAVHSPHAAPWLVSCLSLSALVALAALLPARVVPFLPLAALLLLAARASGALDARLAPPLLGVIAANALLDAAIVAGVIPPSAVPLAYAAQGGLVALALLHGTARPTLPTALLVCLLVRLLALAARLLSGNGASDPDIELFYAYGRATLDLGVPTVEYPSGALAVWALLALGASRELFALLLPLLNLVCDLAIVWAIAQLGRGRREANVLALCYALSPLLLPFWHGKFDPLPAALLLLGVMGFASGRLALAGALLAFGGAVKWAPWLAALPLGVWLLAAEPGNAGWSGRLGSIVRLGGGFALTLALVSLPFAAADLDNFLAPYRLQSGRGMTGESVWFLAALARDPGLLARLAAPWSAVEQRVVPVWLMVGAQAAAMAALTFAGVRRGRDGALAAALLVPAAFLLLNRVFSPQYLLPIAAAALGAAAMRGEAGGEVGREAGGEAGGARWARPVVGALLLAQWANLLVWPATQRWWLLASGIVFVAAALAIALAAPGRARGLPGR